MTREEAKILLPVIQAFSEGKVIQYQTNGKWLDYQGSELGFDLPPLEKNYRIKPELKYRPFKNVEECWNEMLKHQPFGVTVSMNGHNYGAFKALCDDGCDFFDYEGETFESAFDDIKFADGTPFGVMVNEQDYLGYEQELLGTKQVLLGYNQVLLVYQIVTNVLNQY